MLDWINEGTIGSWSVKHFNITREQAMMYAIGSYGSYSIPPRPGKYTGLFHAERGVIMSDTNQEMLYIYEFENMLKKSPGLDVHINGLGLGIFTKHALDKGFRVEVVELDKDVIELVGSQLLPLYPNLNIICADALKWIPPKGKRYGAAWHDIWDSADESNWDQYKLLMRRWCHWARTQGAWGRDWILRQKREENRWKYY